MTYTTEILSTTSNYK